ncbi:hypothetical protein EUZ85_16785 [Hahella sp. KA22]|uniref:transcriptional regulator KorA n=1 Tax=Hahella sp. KA22 TaxID=1628392 RepID=UPI000FDE5697|nr:transcriptional regulator KorA [Hahella sp. KA22]AZZ92294.1 hypothetical protein ENC22_14220 [Hahella sp. KA22]QAY55665.1 hypothetical protein EUZ85_16785 [Hahella sp. KA22]
MTEEQFRIAISGMELAESNRIIAHDLLVKHVRRKLIVRRTGLSNTRIGQIEKNVLANYAKRLEALGLVRVEVLVSPENVAQVRAMEELDRFSIHSEQSAEDEALEAATS